MATIPCVACAFAGRTSACQRCGVRETLVEPADAANLNALIAALPPGERKRFQESR